MSKTSVDACWHWCPIGKHDWRHFVKDNHTKVDAWVKPCKIHQKQETPCSPKS